MNNKKIQELSVESFKDQIFNLAENDFQCPICNEIVVKAHTANCNHTFCYICITTWLGRSNICPICRTNVQTITNCLALDNFISNLCEQIGGTMKQQRDNLLQERASPLPTAKRGRKKAPGGRRPAFTIDLSSALLQPLIDPHRRYSVGRNGNVEIVDLTTSLTR